MDYELRLIDAENTERTASLQLAAADASWREVANRDWDHLPFDEEAFAELGRLSVIRLQAFDAWSAAYKESQAARLEWLNHI